MDESSLSHTKWKCKYHIVFAPKFRRKEISVKLKADIVQILRQLCQRKEVGVIEAQVCIDHIHMLVSIPPKISISDFLNSFEKRCLIFKVLFEF